MKLKIYTYGFGELELLTEDEEYKYSKGLVDAETDDASYIVGEAEEGDPLVEVRERADGTLFAVLVNE